MTCTCPGIKVGKATAEVGRLARLGVISSLVWAVPGVPELGAGETSNMSEIEGAVASVLGAARNPIT
jgi:hypothetical protein